MKMDLEEFVIKTNLGNEDEITRAKTLAFYLFVFQEREIFRVNDIADQAGLAGLPLPNKSRLARRILKSPHFIRANGEGNFRLHPSTIVELEEKLGINRRSRPLSRIGPGFIGQDRLNALRNLQSSKFDYSKFVRLCEEIDANFIAGNYFSVGMLVRAVVDHVPPLFGFKSFSEVANNYPGSKSFQDLMKKLNDSSRKLADSYLHTQIRKRETLPNETQVDFSQSLDALLAEVIRIN